MIKYDSSQWSTLLRISGSVFPSAAKYAFFSGLAAFVLKFLDAREDVSEVEMDKLKLMTKSDAFTMFSATLAFILVFRTSQCYSRFWHCAQSASQMRAQLVEAAKSLVTFTIMSKHPEDDVKVFRHTVVRLFSMLHALCLASFCDRETHFPLIDVESFEEEGLMLLRKAEGAKERVDIVYMWINAMIIQSIDSKLLNAPPPIISRVFQELEKAMVAFHQVQQVMTIPFPFPYAQMAVTLLICMMLFTPVAMCYWTDNAVSAAFLTFTAILCLTSLELIADELDNPFGVDDNDLPVQKFQEELNSTLVLLLNDNLDDYPQIKQSATKGLDEGIRKTVSMLDDFEHELDEQ